MPDEMEQIEARLAAYIDGALPADQRAEIEAYLKANAGHARLITELKSIKSAVSALPREKAPAEVLDTLQSHLERHSLLEGVEESASTSRINRWPQVSAIAAVLLLTAGLGMLVYQVLPRQSGTPTELALLSAGRNADGEAAGGDALLSPGPADTTNAPELAGKSSKDGPAVGTQADESPRLETDGQQQQQSYGNQTGLRPDVQRSQADQTLPFNDSLTAVPPAPQNQTLGASLTSSSLAASVPLSDVVDVLVVRTDDPAITQNLL
ncbi:MAG TPA: hypothetical protein VF595_04300, partial [Tepidisphaeraceae bacterium]